MSLLSRRLYFFLFQRKLFILFSISILIFWNSINLANVSQLGSKHLVSDYIVTSQRESHSLPDMAFLLTFNYFVPFGVIKKRFIKINFNYFNRNCDYSSCPGWWIIFLYAPSHKGYAFWKDCLWTSLSFLYSLKIICILLRQVIKKMVVLSVLFTILISWSPICIPLILLSELMRLKKLFNPKTLINSGILWKFPFRKISYVPTTNKRIGHSVLSPHPHAPNPWRIGLRVYLLELT